MNVGFLLKRCSVNGPTQACRGEFCGLCGVGRKLRVPLELCVDLGDLLVSPQGSQISFGFVIGASGFLMHCSRDR